MKGGPDADQDADEAAQEEHSSQQGRAQNSRQDGDDQHHSQQQQKGNKDGASKEAEPAFSRAEGHKEGSESAENGDSAGKGVASPEGPATLNITPFTCATCCCAPPQCFTVDQCWCCNLMV